MSRIECPPLVDREMRVAARRWTTYWTRVTLVILTVLPAIPYLAMGTLGIQFNFGPTLLLIQAYILFFWVTLAALQMAGDIIASEKREGTLGLLFLTDLSAFDILIDKLAACSMRAWHGLLAVIPALGLPLLLGGVTFGDCLRLAVLLANTLFVALTATILVSCLSRREHHAISWATGVLIVLIGGTPALRACGADHAILRLAQLANPFMGLQSFMSARTPTQDFWKELAAAHALGWLFLGTACVVLPRVWREGTASRRGSWRQRYEQWLFGGPAERHSFRRRALAVGPMFWFASREYRLRSMPWLVLLLIVLALGTWHVCQMQFFGTPFNLAALAVYGWGVQIIYKGWVAATACRVYADPSNSCGLELILATSVPDRELASDPLRALTRRFAGPVITIAIVEIVMAILVSDRSDSGGSSFEGRFLWPFLVLNLILFPLDLASVAVVGLWKGVVSKNASQARAGTTWWILLMPWVCTLGILFLSALSPSTGSFSGLDEPIYALFMFSLMFDIGGFLWAWNALPQRIRAKALERSTHIKTPSLWRRIIAPQTASPEEAKADATASSS